MGAPHICQVVLWICYFQLWQCIVTLFFTQWNPLVPCNILHLICHKQSDAEKEENTFAYDNDMQNTYVNVNNTCSMWSCLVLIEPDPGPPCQPPARVSGSMLAL